VLGEVGEDGGAAEHVPHPLVGVVLGVVEAELLLPVAQAVLGRSEVKSLERADPGKKPGGMATREITAVADVVNVDTKKSTVTVKNKEGETFDLNIRDPEQLKLIKKGDQIQATYTEAVAVSLKPAPTAAPKKK